MADSIFDASPEAVVRVAPLDVGCDAEDVPALPVWPELPAVAPLPEVLEELQPLINRVVAAQADVSPAKIRFVTM